MIKRIGLFAILGLFPLALLLLWPNVREHFTTAEVAVTVARQPREEVLIFGFLKSFGAAPFSIQTLRIEEPGKEAYRRLVSLDADHAFELTLGKPVPGSYRASLLLGKLERGASKSDRWLATQQLTVESGATAREAVQARAYDHPRLFALVGVSVVAWFFLLVVCVRAWKDGVQKTQ